MPVRLLVGLLAIFYRSFKHQTNLIMGKLQNITNLRTLRRKWYLSIIMILIFLIIRRDSLQEKITYENTIMRQIIRRPHTKILHIQFKTSNNHHKNPLFIFTLSDNDVGLPQ